MALSAGTFVKVLLLTSTAFLLAFFFIFFAWHFFSGIFLSSLSLTHSQHGLSTVGKIHLERPVTVVTAYYDIAAKYDRDAYQEWIANFLQFIPCNLYIYTEEKYMASFTAMRSHLLDKTRIVVKPFHDLSTAKIMEFWREQHQIDPEKSVHSPEIYAIWNEKVNFLMEAIKDNPFQSDYFLWTDIGSFRDINKTKWLQAYPNTQAVSRALGKDRIFFLQMNFFYENETLLNSDGLPRHDFAGDFRLGGGIFGGHREAITRYSGHYYHVMMRLKEKGRFVGKDQNIMTAIAVMFPELIHLVQPQRYLNNGNPWFYGQYYLSRSGQEKLPAFTLYSENTDVGDRFRYI